MITVLVTGANRGIGLEYVRQYAQSGAYVFACCRQPEQAAQLGALVKSFPNNVAVHALDVSDDTQINALSVAVGSRPIDVLINNAGVYGGGKQSLGECDSSEWLRTLQVNSIAPYKIIAAFANNVARSAKKTIVGMTSKMGSMDDNGSGGCYMYRSSKAALNAILKSAAIDLRSRGVIVLTLHPGWVRTDMGGSGALISAQTSVTGLRKIIDNASLENSGKFYQYDGTEVPW